MTAYVLAKGHPDRAIVLGNVQSFLARLPDTKSWSIEVSEYHKPRSDSQNRYLWGVAYKALRDATGQDAEDWHEYMLGEWSGWEEYELFGRKKLRPMRRSSKLTTAEFCDYVAFIQQRAAEHGIMIPDADPFAQETA